MEATKQLKATLAIRFSLGRKADGNTKSAEANHR
jgi:hypothetical protein